MTSPIDKQADGGAVNLDKPSPDGLITRTDRRIRIVSHRFVTNWTMKSCVPGGVALYWHVKTPKG